MSILSWHGFRFGLIEFRTTIVTLTALAGLLPSIALGGGDWNDAKVAWMPYEDGLKAAEKSGKPMCLVFYTEWCPHCTAYSKVFHDAKVVEKSRMFVMVRLNKDQHRELSAKYAPDGEYIPRTYFLSAQGDLDSSLHAPRERYKYFFNENDPASILGGMERALAKLSESQGD